LLQSRYSAAADNESQFFITNSMQEGANRYLHTGISFEADNARVIDPNSMRVDALSPNDWKEH
jgi:hypothetical protein